MKMYGNRKINKVIQINEIKFKLTEALKIIREYDWLLNSYVLDFFTDQHWGKMPKSWLNVFNHIKPEDLSVLLQKNNKASGNPSVVWPLSVLAVQVLLQKLVIKRDCKNLTWSIENSGTDTNDVPINNKSVKTGPCYHNTKLKIALTNKRIKQKKRHEIDRMGQLTAQVADELNVKHIIDFGSGLGHLARLLTYGYNLKVCCLEQQSVLTEQARELDIQFENLASKYINNKEMEKFYRPVHLNICLSRQTDFQELVQNVLKAFQIPLSDRDDFSFGIIGLHPCGDLAGILTNLFLTCPQAKFLNLVGCCYMKLSCASSMYSTDGITGSNGNAFFGYPLSHHLRSENELNQILLSYEAKEIACHAIETYHRRLLSKNYDNLRVHSYRAAIEKIICKYWPDKRHSGLKSIKNLGSFREYCHTAVTNLAIQLPECDIDAGDTVENLNNWRNVVIFYTLRLMFAPLVESIILYDRMLFLLENDCEISIQAIFDPTISPRNHILTALKS